MADRTAEPLSNRIGLSLRANFLPRRQPLHFVSAVHALVGPDLGTVALKGVRYAAGKEGDATLIFVGPITLPVFGLTRCARVHAVQITAGNCHLRSDRLRLSPQRSGRCWGSDRGRQPLLPDTPTLAQRR